MPEKRFRKWSWRLRAPRGGDGRVGATTMNSALLQDLMAGAGSSSQFIGGLVVALMYVVIGLLSAVGSILIFRRIFQGRWEQIFWSLFPCRDCRLLPKLRCLFRGLNSCLAN